MNCPSCEADNLDGARFCAKCGSLLPSAEAPEEDTLIGQTVGGRYTIKKILGEGGMGRVYEAERALAGVTQRVAVKTLHQHLSKDPQVVARFHRECRTVAQLRHPNTIKVEDFGQAADGTLYIAMEFVEGMNCAQELEKNGAMPPERVERILGQVCGSLAEAHKQGVVHRDLKPENIVLMNVGDDTDFVKVLDFGIAARKDSTDAAKEAKLTQQGMVLGTPPYMSPEQFMGKELDARSDIYSLGVMAYEMLTGRLPFDANTPWEWATKHMTAQPFPFEDAPTVTDAPSKMKMAIMKAMSKKPEDRHATVREFFEDISMGAARMGLTTTHDVHSPSGAGPAPGPGTAAMTPYESAEGRGSTQAGAPMSLGAGFGPGAAAPTPAPAVGTPSYPTPPPAPPAATSGGGGGKGVLFGIAGVLAIGIVVAVVFILKSGSKGKDDPLTLPTGSSGGTATVTAVNPPDAPTSKPTGVTGVGVTTATTAKPPPTGPEACQTAMARASNDTPGAVAAYGSCTGPERENTRRAIAAAVPGQVQSAVFRNDCRRARQIASAGGSVGASVNVDSQYPQCKGK